ncbi:THAP domain-containing protein 9 [Elysia marginata]|uniref:THAP domain-containing protein 9 n=1 Tax=Elysia marginata TaxID=1093978 RepID=A0AAV4FK51_9GAST|nr:THAP domain-containing protein 9 [Elysia marginata]
MKTLVEKKLIDSDCLQTALFLQTVNDMWDFVNSSSPPAPSAKRAILSSSFAVAEAKFDFFSSFVKSWTFAAHSGKTVRSSLPFHKGWTLCLAAMKGLAEKLLIQDRSMPFLCLRKLNQDHVENLHSQIRGRNGFNDHPMLSAYVSAIKCLACQVNTSELLEASASTGANCELLCEDGEDYGTPAEELTFHSVSFAENLNTSDDIVEVQSSEDISEETECLTDVPPLNVVQVETCAYVAGVVLRSLSKRVKSIGICEKCIALGNTGAPSSSSFSRNKEYKPGSLISVSQPFVDLSCSFEKHFISVVAEGLQAKQPRAWIIGKFYKAANIDKDLFDCHLNMLLDAFLKTYCNIRIFHHVKLLSASLKKGKKGNELNKEKKLNM